MLRLERRHLNRKFGGTLDILQVLELPALELAAIGKIRVFGESVVLPATGAVDGLSPPHACRAIEIEEDVAARTCAVFEDEMSIEQNSFDIREERIIPV